MNLHSPKVYGVFLGNPRDPTNAHQAGRNPTHVMHVYVYKCAYACGGHIRELEQYELCGRRVAQIKKVTQHHGGDTRRAYVDTRSNEWPQCIILPQRCSYKRKNKLWPPLRLVPCLWDHFFLKWIAFIKSTAYMNIFVVMLFSSESDNNRSARDPSSRWPEGAGEKCLTGDYCWNPLSTNTP